MVSSNIKRMRKLEQYNRAMKEKAERELLELNAKAMLLGAEWKGRYFQKITKGVGMGGLPYHYTEYFNRAGEPMKPQEVLRNLAKPWREL